MRSLAILGTTLLSLPASAQGPSPDPLPVPVCAQRQVLQAVQEQLDRAGQPAMLDLATVGEVSAREDLVFCAIRVHRLAYDTNRRGWRPLRTDQVYPYTLRLGHNGIFLQPTR